MQVFQLYRDAVKGPLSDWLRSQSNTESLALLRLPTYEIIMRAVTINPFVLSVMMESVGVEGRLAAAATATRRVRSSTAAVQSCVLIEIRLTSSSSAAAAPRLTVLVQTTYTLSNATHARSSDTSGLLVGVL